MISYIQYTNLPIIYTSTCLHALMHWPPWLFGPTGTSLGDAHCFGCHQHHAIAGSRIVKFVPHGVLSWKLDRCYEFFCWLKPLFLHYLFQMFFKHLSLDRCACNKKILFWFCHDVNPCKSHATEVLLGCLPQKKAFSATWRHPPAGLSPIFIHFPSCNFCKNAKPPIWYCITKSQWVPCAFFFDFLVHNRNKNYWSKLKLFLLLLFKQTHKTHEEPISAAEIKYLQIIIISNLPQGDQLTHRSDHRGCFWHCQGVPVLEILPWKNMVCPWD